MEIPGGEFRIKNKSVRGKTEVGTETAGNTQKGQSPSKESSGTEQVALSAKARDIQRAHEAVKAAPDIRADKVNRIKAEIAQGRFHVDSHDLAEKLLQNIFTEGKFLE